MGGECQLRCMRTELREGQETPYPELRIIQENELSAECEDNGNFNISLSLCVCVRVVAVIA